MAAKKTRDPLPSLTPDQLDTARALYLRRGATLQWVAETLAVNKTSVSAACRREAWDYEKRIREAARTARAKPDAERQVQLEAEQDERHAALAQREIELRERLVEKAAAAVGEMTPREALRALGRFSGLKDLQFVERLARGRMTEKTDSGEEVDVFCHAWMEAIAKGLGVAATSSPPPDPAHVEQPHGA